MYCNHCGVVLDKDAQFCRSCGKAQSPTPVVTPPGASNARFLQPSARRKPWGKSGTVWLILVLIFLAVIAAVIGGSSTGGSGGQASSTVDSSSTPQLQTDHQSVPLPKYRLFKVKTDMPAVYVVPLGTSDEELKSLVWFFRRSVRGTEFAKIGILQPTAKQWGQLGYTSGTIEIYRGEKCANEEYVSDAELEKGHLGPCGYGEHEAASYQWGINADPAKDSGAIFSKNGDVTEIFNYKDNWVPSSGVPIGVDPQIKAAWQAKQEEWEPMQRAAVVISNDLSNKGIDVHASANEDNPKQLVFRSPLFKDPNFLGTFVKDAMPKMRRDLCNVGFQDIRVISSEDSDLGQNYPLHCE